MAMATWRTMSMRLARRLKTTWPLGHVLGYVQGRVCAGTLSTGLAVVIVDPPGLERVPEDGRRVKDAVSESLGTCDVVVPAAGRTVRCGVAVLERRAAVE